MVKLNRNTKNVKLYTPRIIQFGGGNFMRGFVDWMIHELNQETNFDGGVIIVKPTAIGNYLDLISQEGLYTLYLRGLKNGKAVSNHILIDCVQECVDPNKDYSDYLKLAELEELRFVFSNTTEAGIAYEPSDLLNDAPQKSFPGKLTALLYKRFTTFKGASDKGVIVIPCELIDRNGDNLKSIILNYAKEWELGSEFTEWINEDNIFCNTLVDRIVPGYPISDMENITKELGYQDNLVVVGEQFHLLVIEGPKSVKEEFPTHACGLNVIFTDNLEPYRTRKVRILNGAHTSLVPVGYLSGIDNVRESLEDEVVHSFLKEAIFKEICPTLDLSTEELEQFSNDTIDRFKNPYLEHALLSISLNSISKYKTRVLPSVLEYIRGKNELPKNLLFSLAALIAFYKGERNGKPIALKDNQQVLDFFKTQWESNDYDTIVKNVISNTSFWGEDLSRYTGLKEQVSTNLKTIMTKGMKSALKAI